MSRVGWEPQHTVCSRAERDSSSAELLANGDTVVAIFIYFARLSIILVEEDDGG